MEIPRVAIYTRVSTKQHGQTTENQSAILQAYCNFQKWPFVEYEDQCSGGKADREAFQRMFEDARKKKFDLVLFWALDRFSREGVLETLQHLQRLTSYGVGYKSYSEQYLDSTGIFREAIIAILAAIAKQERTRMQERINAGLDRARRAGKKLGPPMKIFDREKAKRMRQEGVSYRVIAVEVGVSKDTVANLCRKAR